MRQNESFRFKQFYVRHDRCAMKVGTDGVLLGAWAPIQDFKFRISNFKFTILDVGTGCGLIARMLMQRCEQAAIEAKVEGIDIDEAAVEQARENGVNAYLSSLQDWQIVNRQLSDCQLYDLVVSNPPYFVNSLKNPDEQRRAARHTDSLSYEELIVHSVRLMKENGLLALIVPADAEEEIRQLAQINGLCLARATRVYSKEGKAPKRVLMAFEKLRIKNYELKIDSLVLEDEHGGRSQAYQELTKDFYL